MLKIPRDHELKSRRGYMDPKSIVYADGREVLKGEDWRERKKELWERCGGKCEYRWTDAWWMGQVRGAGCSSEAMDPHHIIKRSKKRDDRLANLQALCRFHHRLIDPRKVGGTKREEIKAHG